MMRRAECSLDVKGYAISDLLIVLIVSYRIDVLSYLSGRTSQEESYHLFIYLFKQFLPLKSVKIHCAKAFCPR